MAAEKSTSFFWDRLVPTIYSAGAAVVIAGAYGENYTHMNNSLSWLLTAGLINRG